METESPAHSHTEENSEEREASLAVSLDILDSYELPDLQENTDEGTGKPAGKKQRLEGGVPSAVGNRKPRGVLGDDYREQEERRLEQLLFGKLLFKKPEPSRDKETSEAVVHDTDETSGDSSAEEDSTEEQEVLPSDKFGKALGLHSSDNKKPAWTDVDDQTIKLKDVVATYKRGAGRHGSKETSETNYNQILKKNFATAHGQTDTPKWARLDDKGKGKRKSQRGDSDTDEDAAEAENDSLLRTAGNFLQTKSVALPQGLLRYKEVKDVNQMTRAEGAVILGVEFHKRDNVALVAGLPGIVSLFQVDGRTNSKIQTVHFDKFPISCAHFSSDGDEFLATSQRLGHINVYNMVSGKVSVIPHNKSIENGTMKSFVPSPDGKIIAFQGRFGYVHLMSAKSKEWITSLKMNGNVQAFTFSPDGSRLYTHGEFGEVYVWDMNTRQCVHKFHDEGCIAGTSIAVSPSQQYIACGSGSGVVNIYETASLENQMTPKPAKVLLNLVTSVNSLKFHPSSEMLCMASNVKEHAVRMVHFPSLTVFQNFPNLQNKWLSQVKCCDFSPNGGYLAFGNDRAAAKLYRLPHYAEY